MGNSFSTEVSLEEFRDQVFGTAIFLLSKEANPRLDFKHKNECTSDNLPLPKIDSDNIYEVALSYYGFPAHQRTDKYLDDKIEEYVYKNIINSKENMTRFYKILIDRLLAKSQYSPINSEEKIQPPKPEINKQPSA